MTEFRIEIRPAAKADIAAAAGWYEAMERGLGERFIHSVIKAIDSLVLNASIYRVQNRRLRARWLFTEGFPYRVVYRIEGDLVTVVAVVHASRRDARWKTKFR